MKFTADMTRAELRTWLVDYDADDEVWRMTGTREYVIGMPDPEDGEAEYIATVAELIEELSGDD